MAKSIVELVQQGHDEEAETLSEYGTQLSFEGSFIRLYYDALDCMEAAMRLKKSLLPMSHLEADIELVSEIQAAEKKLKERAECISGIFIEAVNSHDREMIINLADAVWFFKGKRGPQFVPADLERSQLLFLKSILKHTGEKLTIRQIAQFLALRNLKLGQKLEIKTPDDGFSALRRKCIELNIPFVPASKIRKK